MKTDLENKNCPYGWLGFEPKPFRIWKPQRQLIKRGISGLTVSCGEQLKFSFTYCSTAQAILL